MSQEEVREYLEKNGEASAKEISEAVGITIYGIWENLSRMLKHNEVQKRKLSKEEVEDRKIKFTGRHFVWVFIEDED